jgi:NitT/TauT family transport system ATP-binding protein
MTGKPDPPIHIRARDACASVPGAAGSMSTAGPFTLDIPQDSFVALIGLPARASGAILRLIGGLDTPLSGEVLLRGKKIDSPQRSTGFVFPNPSLLASRTALGNVLLQAELHGLTAATKELRARELLSLIGAGDHVDTFSRDLPPAAAQRVAICRALLLDPELLLLDDPFHRLEPLEREQLVRDLQRLHLENYATVVMASPSIQEAVLLADLIAILAPPGRIERVIEVDLPRPRRIDKATAPKIVEYCTTVRTSLEALGVLT